MSPSKTPLRFVGAAAQAQAQAVLPQAPNRLSCSDLAKHMRWRYVQSLPNTGHSESIRQQTL